MMLDVELEGLIAALSPVVCDPIFLQLFLDCLFLLDRSVFRVTDERKVEAIGSLGLPEFLLEGVHEGGPYPYDSLRLREVEDDRADGIEAPYHLDHDVLLIETSTHCVVSNIR